MQPWSYAGYVYDAFSFAGIASTIITTIATVAGANGWGWLAPLAIPMVGYVVQGILSFEGKGKVANLSGESRKEYYLNMVTVVVNFVAGAVGVMVGTGAVTAAAATTAIVSFLMLVLEALRVKWLDRQTIYGKVYELIKARCGSGSSEGAVSQQGGYYSV